MAKAKAQSASAKHVAAGSKKATPASTKKVDVLAEVAQEVENLTQPKAFAMVDDLVALQGRNDFQLGGILAAIKDKSQAEGGDAWLEGHDSFKTLCDKRFNILHRKADYLIGIYKHLVEKQIPWEEVKGLGWTKLKDLAPILTPKNVEGWVKKAEKMTVLELQNAVSAAKNKGSDATEKATAATEYLSIKVHKDQKRSIRAAIDKAKDESKCETDAQALHLVSQTYLGGAAAGQAEDAAPGLPKSKKAKFALLKEVMTALDDWEGVINTYGEVYPKIKVSAEEE